MSTPIDRTNVTRRLNRGQSVELDWSLVLHPPSAPGAPGANGSYRWVFYEPPLREDGTRGKRVGLTARKLDDHAWQRIEAKLRELEGMMSAQATGSRLDATFGVLAEHWYDPAGHPDWSDDYPAKVKSVTTNWLTGDAITVTVPRPGDKSEKAKLRDLQLGELRIGLLIEALEHVRRERAYGTYRSAHECVTGILTWGVTNKWLPAGHIEITDIKRAPDPRAGARRRKGARGNIAPVPKDDIPDLDQVLLPFHRWVEDHVGRRERILLDLLAFSGPRIGEALAFHHDRFERDDEGNGWAAVVERADKSSKQQRPPKHRKHRDVWVPAWLADDLETLSTNDDGYYFGAAQGSTQPVGRWRERRFDKWATAYGWAELKDYCPHKEGGECPGKEKCKGQARRRWRHSVHDWRHAAAVWQLFELRLDPEDVAAHLGHGDGYTLYQLYVGSRPSRERRAAKAAAELGDPRA